MVDVTTYKFGEKNLFKVGSFSINKTTASGTQAVTGVGFTPSVLFFITCEDGAAEASFGRDDGSAPYCVYATADYVDGWNYNGTNSLMQYQGGGTYYLGKVNSMDSDGFTIGWTRAGAPGGTFVGFYLAMA